MDDLQKPEPKPRGRPKVDEPKAASITAWFKPSEYDRLLALAKKEDQSLSALIRGIVGRKL